MREITKATRHSFFDSAYAYDACQTDEHISDGDTLICKDDGVVGLAYIWPVAVTVERGALHGVQNMTRFLDITGIAIEQVQSAVGAADERGLEVNPQFRI